MRAHWSVALLTAAVMVLGGAAGAALATDPVTLSEARVLDEANVLTDSEEQAVNTRLQALTDRGADLWVVYVDEFTSPANRYEWADAVAERNGLGTHQYLLAVATEGRQFAISAAQEGPVSWEKLDDIEQQRIQPALASSDWAGAAMAAAEGMEQALPGGGSASAGSIAPFLLVLVLGALAVVVIVIVVRSRRKAVATPGAGPAPTGDEWSGLSTAELSRRAASALVQTDDAVKTSEQELGFAQAQFGDATAAEFTQTLTMAKGQLDEAFSLKQKLDDSVPDTEEDVRAWNIRILKLCAEANAALDEKAAAFDQLRKLEQNAPEALERVQSLYATVAAAQPAASAALTTLAGRYAPDALTTVSGNPAQAEQLLSFAKEHLAAAQTAVGAGDGSRAAVEIRGAEDAVGQAGRLHEAITKMGTDLAEAEQSAARLVAEIQAEIAEVSAMPDPQQQFAPVIASTRQQLEASQAQLSGSGLSPLAAVQQLTAADAQIDALLAGARDLQQQAQRAARQLGMALAQAQAQVSAAEDFITSRRGAIGAQARTRLADAGASLVHAQQLETADPAQALALAQRAQQQASEAIRYAQNDVGAFSGDGLFGGNSGGGGNMMGAILGGILVNSMLGGGGGRRSGGGYGGGRRSGGGYGGGRPSSGGFGGSFGGGRTPGSFGGGGTRGRRGGGRF